MPDTVDKTPELKQEMSVTFAYISQVQVWNLLKNVNDSRISGINYIHVEKKQLREAVAHAQAACHAWQNSSASPEPKISEDETVLLHTILW